MVYFQKQIAKNYTKVNHSTGASYSEAGLSQHFGKPLFSFSPSSMKPLVSSLQYFIILTSVSFEITECEGTTNKPGASLSKLAKKNDPLRSYGGSS